MKTVFSMAALLFLLCLPAVSSDVPEAETMPWRNAVRRIDSACEIALRRAEGEQERNDVLRLRNRELAVLVDITYQSLLAWMARRPYLTAAFEDEQTLWRKALEERHAAGEDRLESTGAMLRERLRVFGRIIAGGGEYAGAARR